MPVRIIFCAGCNKHVGELRDATLRMGIVVLCKDCETKRKAEDLYMKTKVKEPFDDFMDMIRRKV